MSLMFLLVSDKEDYELLRKDISFFYPFDFIISCGDLEKEFLESLQFKSKKYIIGVYGNHDDYELDSSYFVNLDKNKFYFKDYILFGFEGSHFYNGKGRQYTQFEMFLKVLRKLPMLFYHKLKKSKIIIVSHAPLYSIHDREDQAHQGFKAFLFLQKLIKPFLWIHGHVHLKDRFFNRVTYYNKTTIINIFSYKILKINDNGKIQISNR